MDGAWRMMVNYCNITKALAPITAASPDVLSVLEQIDVDSGTWYAAIDLVSQINYYLLLSQRKVRNSSHSHHVEWITACIYKCTPWLC